MSRQISTDRTAQDEHRQSSRGRLCPCCNGPAKRIARLFIDHLISRFYSVRRYRCNSQRCGWEGRLHERRLVEVRAYPGHGRIYVLEAARMDAPADQPSR